jgi:hypothetical protein
MRTCTRCRRTLPVSEFYPNSHGPDLRYSHCRECCVETMRARRRGGAPRPARAAQGGLDPRWPTYFLNSRMDLLGASLRALTE